MVIKNAYMCYSVMGLFSRRITFVDWFGFFANCSYFYAKITKASLGFDSWIVGELSDS